MTPRIDELRSYLREPLPHPDRAAMADLGQKALDYVVNHFATLPEQKVGQALSRKEMEALLYQPLPEEGVGFGEILRDFHTNVAPYAMRVNHPRFFAFIPSSPSFYSVIGDFICGGMNFFNAVWIEACGPAQVELVVLDWFRQILGYPSEARGLLTSGGSEANMTALVAARQRLAFADRSRAVLYMSQQRHLSIDRAARIIGLHPEQLRSIPVDADYRLIVREFVSAIKSDRAQGRVPWLVVANAGATNTGVVDPLEELADVCLREGLWMHVDAAYGWAAALHPSDKNELAGIDRADSITFDPHKWFSQTYEAGCVLVRDGKQLVDAFALQPDYMQDVAPTEEEINFSDLSVALTRRFRALKIWMSVRALGLGWFRNLIEHTCRLAEYAQLLLEQSDDFEVVSPRRLSIVCFRYHPRNIDEGEILDRLNSDLTEAVRLTGRAFLSSTRLQGRVVLRFCFVNWRTTARDVDEVLRLMSETARETLATRFPEMLT
ncbi:MAG: L-2,4-diaminobutyrate decarboxylase [Gemmatales bacterium]|nr:MAG: L-2,4-diaminobutyrate decarboxylase [Gemmatales bacterium]